MFRMAWDRNGYPLIKNVQKSPMKMFFRPGNKLSLNCKYGLWLAFKPLQVGKFIRTNLNKYLANL